VGVGTGIGKNVQPLSSEALATSATTAATRVTCLGFFTRFTVDLPF
jgi:hypothetical protein